MFSGRVLLVTGGTGSFGNAVVRRFLDSSLDEIRILSRDEKKQEDMRIKYGSKKLKFFIGDVRDRSSVDNAMVGVDFVFHAAALKQVPSCEFFPLEAVNTNVMGTSNVIDSAVSHNVGRVVVLSTDKAVYPINAMGMSKALMEKVAVAKSRTNDNTVINITRYGNVMCSRGSVIPLFTRQIRAGKRITITDPNMTRFMMTLDDAVDLVMFAFRHGRPGELFVQKAPAATIEVLAKALIETLGAEDGAVELIGARHGEKLYEVLLSREEMLIARDREHYFSVPADNRDLNYANYVDSGIPELATAEEYTSHNTQRLAVHEMQKLLLKLNYIKAMREGREIDPEE